MTQKKQSELTAKDYRNYEWVQIDNEDDPTVISGMKKTELPPPPDGYVWVDVTALGDAEKRYILGLDDE